MSEALEIAQKVANQEKDKTKAWQQAVSEKYIFKKVVDDIQTFGDGLTTGIKELDKLTTIPQPSLTLISGRPSSGKTSFLVYLTSHFLAEKKPVVFFTLEVHRAITKLQLAINKAKKDAKLTKPNPLKKHFDVIEEAIRNKWHDKDNPKTINAIKEQLKQLDNKPITLFEHTALEDIVGIIDTKMQLLTAKEQKPIFIIDYIQKIKPRQSKGTRQQEVQLISNELLQLSRKWKVAIICGAQLNRDQNAQLREAGDLEQDASVIYQIEESEDSPKKPPSLFIDVDGCTYYNRVIQLKKSRRGKIGLTMVKFYPERFYFCHDDAPFIEDKNKKQSKIDQIDNYAIQNETRV